MKKKMDLRLISPRDYDHRKINQHEMLKWFENEDAAWVYEGKPSSQKAHAELTSGFCSDGFFDCLKVLRYPNIAEILARQLVNKLVWKEGIRNISWVVSSSYASIVFGHEVAKALKAIFLMTEKDLEDSGGNKMIWSRMTIPAHVKVLRVEELITSGHTFKEVTRAVEEGNEIKQVNFVPIVGTLIHRPLKLPADYDGIKIVSLIEKEVRIFSPANCPYCQVGSPKYRPKTNWAELVGKK